MSVGAPVSRFLTAFGSVGTPERPKGRGDAPFRLLLLLLLLLLLFALSDCWRSWIRSRRARAVERDASSPSSCVYVSV